MFRKIMQISDSLMFRYYELLTDVSMEEISAMQERMAKGELHPMTAKMELGQMIVTDFHSAAEAGRAAEEFNRVVRQKETPADIRIVPLPEGVRAPNGLVNVEKLIARAGLAESVSDASRKRKAGAIEINGQRVTELLVPAAGGELLIHVGKGWVRVTTGS
jgi:tyrosyl-tRNA synthetase